MRLLPWSARSWLTTSHAVTGLFLSIPIGVTAIVLAAAGIGTIPAFGLGLLVLLLALWGAHGAAAFELGRIALLLGDRIRLRPMPPGTGRTWPDMWSRLTSGAAWLQLAHACLRLVVAPVLGTLVLGFWSGGLALVLLPAYAWALPTGLVTAPWFVALMFLAGIAALALAPWVAEGAARTDVAMARGMLGTDEVGELTARVTELRQTRAAVVDAADAERRRIERDLHDGAQQQLVALAMNLGMARAKLDDDPEAARDLVERAHGEAKQAITELRNVIRGVHPAVLTDRGLDAALSALAARSPVPVHVDVEVHERPSPTIEAVAYFVVAEALTNVAKHSGAGQALVHVRRVHDALRLEVADDGHGGATATPGGGLAGLADRVRAVDGTFSLTSPEGKGTLITVELPCAS